MLNYLFSSSQTAMDGEDSSSDLIENDRTSDISADEVINQPTLENEFFIVCYYYF